MSDNTPTHNFNLHVITAYDNYTVNDVRAIRIAPNHATIHLWHGDTEEYGFFHTHGVKSIELMRAALEVGDD